MYNTAKSENQHILDKIDKSKNLALHIDKMPPKMNVIRAPVAEGDDDNLRRKEMGQQSDIKENMPQ